MTARRPEQTDPAWPLTLLAGRDGGDPDPTRAERAERVTAKGDHPSTSPPGRSWLERAATEVERAQARTELLGLSFTQVLRAFSHAWVERLQIVEAAGDVELGPMLERTELRLGEMAGVLRQSRARAAAVYFG